MPESPQHLKTHTAGKDPPLHKPSGKVPGLLPPAIVACTTACAPAHCQVRGLGQAAGLPGDHLADSPAQCQGQGPQPCSWCWGWACWRGSVNRSWCVRLKQCVAEWNQLFVLGSIKLALQLLLCGFQAATCIMQQLRLSECLPMCCRAMLDHPYLVCWCCQLVCLQVPCHPLTSPTMSMTRMRKMMMAASLT